MGSYLSIKAYPPYSDYFDSDYQFYPSTYFDKALVEYPSGKNDKDN